MSRGVDLVEMRREVRGVMSQISRSPAVGCCYRVSVSDARHDRSAGAPAGKSTGKPRFFQDDRGSQRFTLAHFLHFGHRLTQRLSRLARARNRNNRCSPPRRRPGCETRRAPRLRCAHTRTPTLTTHRTQTDARETSTISDQRVRARRVRPTFQRGAYVWRDD